MAKHYTPKQRKARKALLAGAATAGVSGALVLAQGIDAGKVLVDLSATTTVIGIGGRDDATSANIPAKLFHSTVPAGATYIPILYPASLDLGGSRDAGVPTLDTAIRANPGSTGNATSIVGYSEGTLVAEQEKRNLQELPVGTGIGYAPAGDTLAFTQIASPFAGNGGIFGRFQEIPTFLIVDNMGSAAPSRYDTHYVVNEYDPYGDFPAYANPFSLANSLLAVEYAHPDQYYDAIQTTGPNATPKLGPDVSVPNGGGGTDTYTIYYNSQLPLLGPIRQGAALIGVSQYVEPELELVEPTLRVLVDAGYTDRTNADPATPTPFSLITPPQNIIGAAAALPGAAEQGIDNFLGKSQSISPLSTQAVSPLNKSIAPASTGTPAVVPSLAPQLKVPSPPAPKPPQADPPTTTTPTPDLLKLPDAPKTPAPSTSPRGNLPNLGSLVNSLQPKPNVLAGGNAGATKPPAFGAGRPAGVVAGALKSIGSLADGLTGKKPTADSATP